MKAKFTLLILASVAAPFTALAQVMGPCAPMTLKCFVEINLYPFVAQIINLIFAATVVFFLWNIFQFVKKSDQPEELEKFKSKALWGVIALAVMFSLWGLVKFVTSSVNLDNTPSINVRTGVY